MIHYILDDHRLAVPTDLMTWGEWLERASETRERVVAQEDIGSYWVSTVFVGIDMSFNFGDPLLFETMLFDRASDRPWSDVWMNRCSTWDEAVDMHEEGVREAQRLLRLLPMVI